MEAKQLAEDFLATERGKFVVSKALHLAIEKLKSQTDYKRDWNMINDMTYLLDNVFPMYKNYLEKKNNQHLINKPL